METTVITEQSSELGELFAALAAAQLEMENADKTSLNPHFRSKYADLAEVRSVTIPALAKHKLALTQQPVSSGDLVGVRTLLGHASGQWIASTYFVRPSKPDAQGAGSVITYLRRYALAAIAGIAQEDDDGETDRVAAQASKPLPTSPQVPVNEAHLVDLLKQSVGLADLQKVKLEATKLPEESRKHVREMYAQKKKEIEAKLARDQGKLLADQALAERGGSAV